MQNAIATTKQGSRRAGTRAWQVAKMISVAVSAFAVLSMPGASFAQAMDTQQVATFDPAQGELPESIAFDDAGNGYVSMSNTIRKIAPDGQVTLFATLPIQAFALGVKVGPEGCVYTASTSLTPGLVGAFVWRICAEGQVQQFAVLDPNGGPNDLAFDRRGDLYVTDAILGVIWKVNRAGQAQLWLDHPSLKGDPTNPALLFSAFGVDGIAFDKHQRTLYVGNLDRGTILRIPVCDGLPGAVSTLVESPLLRGADGIAFDKKGTLFVAVGAQDRLASVAPDGTVTVLAEGGALDGPSSVAFGTGRHDARTLYVTNLAILRAFGLAPGTPRPSLVRTRVDHKGLRLR